MLDKTYKYQVKKRWLFVVLAAAFGASLYFTYGHINDPNYIVKYHRITFSKTNGLVFLYAILAASVGLFTCSIFGLLLTFWLRKAALTTQAIEIPKTPFSFKTLVVPYQDITDIKVQESKNTIRTLIQYKGGSIKMPELSLADSKTFYEFCSVLSQRITSKNNSFNNEWLRRTA